ncbi:MAG: hypothetical protein IPK26_06140 [Planctomycetes bacterium]|nr:hypothetical protein [Planctomycetota bacterium]
MHSSLVRSLVLLAASSAAGAQNLCEGNGLGSAYIRNTPAILGGSATVELGSPADPFGAAFLSFSTGIGPTTSPIPFVGTLCFDVFSPIYSAHFHLLDAAGRATSNFAIPNDPTQLGYAPLFLNNAVLRAGPQLSISKTTRLQWEQANQHRLLPPQPTVGPRHSHTATALWQTPHDNRQDVLIAGGATGSIVSPAANATTAIFSPLTRTLRAGPFLSLPRAFHASILLPNGKVLISGGSTTNAAGTATCDLYDPANDSIVPVASMNFPRMGHRLSLLPNGRVLATGGFADFQNAASNWAARLGTAQSTTEVYDPIADVWTVGPSMASRRAGHAQVTLLDGRILVIAGVSGGTTINVSGTLVQIPTYTQSCEFLDPTTLTFALGPALPLPSNIFAPNQGRGFHGASVLPNGDVLVTGGAANIGSNGISASTADCVRFNGTAWVAAGVLPIGVSFHTQVTDPDTGDAIVTGGFTAEFGFAPSAANVARHNGTTVTALTSMGLHSGLGQLTPSLRALHTCTVMQDGTLFVFGGQNPEILHGTITTHADGLLYIR